MQNKKQKNLKKFSEEKPSLSTETKKMISGVILVVLALILFLSFFDLAGQGGNLLKRFSIFLIGKTAFLLPLLFIFLAILFFKKEYRKVYYSLLFGILIFILGISAILSLTASLETKREMGGLLGYLISQPISSLFEFWASFFIFLALILIGLLILGQFLLPKRKEKPLEEKPSLFKKIFLPKFKVKEIPPIVEEEKTLSKEIEKAPVPPLDLKVKPIEKEILAYQPPPFNFLESDSGLPSAGDIKTNSAIIKRTLLNFDIPVEMGQVNIGPTVTQYTLKPAEGVKLSKITALSNDLSLALAAHPIRIEAPIPGKSLVGIEVPNKIRTLVRLRDLISLPEFQNSPFPLTFILGRDVSGNPVYADLSRMPHLLVAGSTGTGKTCAADTLMVTEKGLLTFEELCHLPLNSEADFKIKLVARDGIEATEKIYNNGICQFYKITTRRGFQIEVTAEHPLWVINKDGSQIWKSASLIKKGDYLAINRGPALFGNKVDLSDFEPSKIRGNIKKISFPSIMTPQLAQFLGLLTADGGLSVEKRGTHRVVYTQANPKLLSLYKKLLKELFGITQFIERRSGSNLNNKAKDIEVNSIQLKEFLTFLGMKSVKAPQKEIPRAIREAAKEIVASYLRALFDNDGYSGEKTPIEISLSSKKLLSQVQIMLLNFGIVSSLKPKKVKNYPQNEYFRLSIYGEDGRKFIKEIGFLRDEKYLKVKKLLKLVANPNLDVIPNISLLLKKIGQKYFNNFAKKGGQYQSGISVPKYAFISLKSYNSGARMPSYYGLEKILDFYRPIVQEPKYQELEKIFQRNFYWDKVEKISQTSGVGYDFFVPGSDSFVGNGFINHNTIFLNSLISSLIYRNSPEILKFILIDPKRVEFPVYSNLPHLLAPVILDVKGAVNALRWLIMEMERRFEIFSAQKVRDINSYNEEFQKRKKEKEIGNNLMPYIVLIIDELADLMAARGREIEAGIVRLAQMARAVGIHLVVATQRPSVEVITGLIKANITSRIAFQVASQVDSRTVFDMAGAEKLLGSGDMLYIAAEIAKPKRIQAAYISEKEIKRVVNWLSAKSPKLEKIEFEELERAISQEIEREEEFDIFTGGEDPLYEEAKKLVIASKKASASFLQRRLRIGYARAARLIDMLEERGVVGPGEGAKPRKVYFNSEEENRSTS